jgi:16S rRNA (adenine1518-N6/adenine1519-N6)-dimethyltransferase
MDLRDALRRFNITPKKSLGQNFLFDPVTLDRIVTAADVGPNDTVLEIGPGAGSLTRHLAHAAARVVAVELDNRLLPVLEYATGDLPNVAIVHGDILEVDPATIARSDDFSRPGQTTEVVTTKSQYKVVANIPYYITAPIIRRLLESPVRPSLIVLTVQREVAERICAAPPEMSVLAVSVQFYGTPRIVGHVPAGAFYPKPDVDSAIVRIDLFDQPPLTGVEANKFFEVVKAGFSQKRKQIRNSLASGLRLKGSDAEKLLSDAGIDPSRRAETLTVEEWVRLSGGRVVG